jgi:glutathione S-transferase
MRTPATRMPSAPSGPPHAAQVVSLPVRLDIANARVRINSSRRWTSSHDKRALSGRVIGLGIRALCECAHLVERRNLLNRLITIPISHFCEKARWALDRAGVEYVEERHVQGIHRFVARRAGGGTTVPVLVTGERVLSESEAILRYADERLEDDLKLFPAEPDLRDEVVGLCRELDAGLGPDGRRLMYALMLEQKGPMLRVNNQGVPAWEGRAMSALWPLATRWGRRELGIGADTVRVETEKVRREFDAAGERLRHGRAYLCGERFTAADLTFAALAAAVIVPPEYGVRLPQPDELPQHIASMVRGFREHPAGTYAMELFRTERRRAAAAG